MRPFQQIGGAGNWSILKANVVEEAKGLGNLTKILQEALTGLVSPAQDICSTEYPVGVLPVHAVSHVYQQLDNLGGDLRQDYMPELARLKTQYSEDGELQGQEKAVHWVAATFLIHKDSIGL